MALHFYGYETSSVVEVLQRGCGWNDGKTDADHSNPQRRSNPTFRSSEGAPSVRYKSLSSCNGLTSTNHILRSHRRFTTSYWYLLSVASNNGQHRSPRRSLSPWLHYRRWSDGAREDPGHRRLRGGVPRTRARHPVTSFICS